MQTFHCENACPVGAEHCSLLDEVGRLREQCRRLEELSYVDALTGLYNFRHLQRALEMEMERSRRTGLPTGLIMIDLDHFKDINNVYGHQTGNAVLASVGKFLRENVRIIDVPCRYGGEEFALILPSTSLVQAASIAERLRAMLSERSIETEERGIVVTASFGVAVFRCSETSTASEFLARADTYLLQAKQMGRNCVCSQDFGPLQPSEVTPEEKGGLFAKAGAKRKNG